MAKKVLIRSAGGYEKLEIVSAEAPRPQNGEVLIEVKAAGVNFADCCVRMGVYASAKEYVGWPITPGFEVAGVVIESKSPLFKVGDRVIGVTLFNGYSSHLALPEEFVFPLPASLSFSEGASFPAIFLTAWFALCELAHPRKGQKLLVHSAAGGVGSSLVQIGKIFGCHVTGVVGKPHKVEFAKEMGADVVLEKSSLWGPEKYDVVLDANGAETLKESYRHLNPGGKLVVYGFHTMLTKGRGTPNWVKIAIDYLKTPRFNPLSMTSDNHSVLAFNLSFLFDQMPLFREAFKNIFEWLEEGKIRVPEIREFPLEKVAEAHQILESGETIGKIVIIFN